MLNLYSVHEIGMLQEVLGIGEEDDYAAARSWLEWNRMWMYAGVSSVELENEIVNVDLTRSRLCVKVRTSGMVECHGGHGLGVVSVSSCCFTFDVIIFSISMSCIHFMTASMV